MEKIKILKDSDIFKNPKYQEPKSYEERQTVKVIIKNKKGEIALITNPVHKFFLLPGGGADSDDLEKEVEREALEEINYYIGGIKEIGKIEEFRNRDAKHYITTGFVANTVREGNKDLRTEEEKKNGLEVHWFEYDEALGILSEQVKKVEQGEVKFYNTAFNIVRDYYFVSLIN